MNSFTKSANATEALEKPTIAELSPTQIANMSCDELAEVVMAAKLPLLRSETERHLKFSDRATLQRMAHLARRCCRNQGY